MCFLLALVLIANTMPIIENPLTISEVWKTLYATISERSVSWLEEAIRGLARDKSVILILHLLNTIIPDPPPSRQIVWRVVHQSPPHF